MFSTVYGNSENGNILCLGVRLEDGSIGEIPMKRSRICNKALTGSKVVFYDRDTNKYYDIEVIEYLCQKYRPKKFIVKYKNNPTLDIQCGNFIKQCQIVNIVNDFQSKNSFKKNTSYYTMTIETKGTKAEEDFNGGVVEILFDGSEEVVKAIMNSSWYLKKNGKSKDTYYIQTNSYNQTGQSVKLHRAVFGEEIKDNLVVNHLKRFNGSWKDNRLSNLELVTRKANSKNKNGAGFPSKHGNGWKYQLTVDGFKINTPVKKNYEEADLDALIVQEYFSYTHRQDEWYKTKNIDLNYKQELIKIMTEKLEKAKIKGIIFTKNELEIVKINGKKFIKIVDCNCFYTLIDEEAIGIVEKGRISINKNNYWSIKTYEGETFLLHRYLLGIDKTERYSHLQVDHINQNPLINTKENLIITSVKGNLINKKGRGYSFEKPYYRTNYKGYFDKIKEHPQINSIKKPSYKTEQEAKEEVYKRKWLSKHIRPQFKNLNEYLVFEEEYNLNKKDGQTLDDYWIETKFPNINEIEIPKYEENKEE